MDFGAEEEGCPQAGLALPAAQGLDLEKFERFLRISKRQADSSTGQHLRCLLYFFGLWELPAEGFDPMGFIAGLYKSGKASDWLSLPIMDPSIPNVRNIHLALDHYLDFLTIEALRSRYWEAHRCLGLFKVEALDPSGKACVAAREVADARNREKAAQALCEMPGEQELK